MRRALAALLALPLLAGCPGRAADAGELPAERDPDAPPAGEQVTVELTFRPLEGGDDGGGRVTAEGRPGAIAVQGALSAPTPCHILTGAARRDSAVITLTVSVTPGEGMCVQSIGAFTYDATVRGMPAGSYTFRVLHTYPQSGWQTRPALDTTLDVS